MGAALAEQTDDPELKAVFRPLANSLMEHEAAINAELLAAQGRPVDIGGYYHPVNELADPAMRPSTTLNAVINALAAS